MSKLASCPFCGAAPHKGLTKPYPDQLHGDLLQHFRIWCPHGCASKRAINESLAVDAWNTRAFAQAVREPVSSMRAQWTYDPEVHAYYFAPVQASPPPYNTREVTAIIDIANDGTLAGVELIDNMPPPPSSVSSTMQLCPDWRTCKCKDGCAHSSTNYRCTCGAEPYCAADQHDISCPLAVPPANRNTEAG